MEACNTRLTPPHDPSLLEAGEVERLKRELDQAQEALEGTQGQLRDCNRAFTHTESLLLASQAEAGRLREALEKIGHPLPNEPEHTLGMVSFWRVRAVAYRSMARAALTPEQERLK